MNFLIKQKYYTITLLLLAVVGCSNAQPPINRIVKPDTTGKFIVKLNQHIKGDENLYLVAPNGYIKYFSTLKLVKYFPYSGQLKNINIPFIKHNSTNITNINYYNLRGEKIKNKNKNYSDFNPFTFYKSVYKKSIFGFKVTDTLRYMSFQKQDTNGKFNIYFDPGFLSDSIQKIDENDNVELLKRSKGWGISFNDTILISDTSTFKKRIEKIQVGQIEIKSTYKALIDTIYIKITKNADCYSLYCKDNHNLDLVESTKSFPIQPDSSLFFEIHLKRNSLLPKNFKEQLDKINDFTYSIKYNIPPFVFKVRDGIYFEQTFTVNEGKSVLVLHKKSSKNLLQSVKDVYYKHFGQGFYFAIGVVLLVSLLIIWLLFILIRKSIKFLRKFSISISHIDEKSGGSLPEEYYNRNVISEPLLRKIHDVQLLIENQSETEKIIIELKVLTKIAERFLVENKGFSDSLKNSEETIEKLNSELDSLNDIKNKLEYDLKEQIEKTNVKQGEIENLNRKIVDLNNRIRELERSHSKEINQLKVENEKIVLNLENEIKSLESYLKERLPYYYTNTITTLNSLINIYNLVVSNAKSTRSNYYKELVTPVLGNGRNDNGLLSVFQILKDLETLKVKIPAFSNLIKLKANDNQVKKELLKIIIGDPKKSFVNKIAVSYAYISSKDSPISKVLLDENINEELIRRAYVLLSNCLLENFNLELVIPKLFTDLFDNSYHSVDLKENYMLLEYINPDISTLINKTEKNTIRDIVYVGYKCDLLDEFNSKPVVITK